MVLLRSNASFLHNTETETHGCQSFNDTKRLLDRLLPVFGKITVAAWFLYTASPLFIICKAYLTHTAQPELFVAPLRDMYYFFDASHSPLFEITYAANALKIGFVCMGFMLVNVLFVELAAYVLAAYGDLRAMVGAMRAEMSSTERTAALRNCIRMHLEIIRCECGEREAKKEEVMGCFIGLIFLWMSLSISVTALSMAHSLYSARCCWRSLYPAFSYWPRTH